MWLQDLHRGQCLQQVLDFGCVQHVAEWSGCGVVVEVVRRKLELSPQPAVTAVEWVVVAKVEVKLEVPVEVLWVLALVK